MAEELLKGIEGKLDIIIKLLCSKCVEGKSSTDSILTLEKIGVERKFIAEITGSTLNSIRATISMAKKKTKEKPGKKKPKEVAVNEQAQG